MQRFTALTLTAAAAAALTAGCNENADDGSQGPVTEAPAVALVNSQGEIIGEVRGGDSDEGATLFVEARGLPPGVHGMHIHEVGLCEPPDFTSAGGHWNPTNVDHGRGNPQGAHLGDLENVTVGEDGMLRAEVVVPGTYLRTAGRDAAPGAHQILDASGAALVIHAGADDYQTDPSGDSGARIACAELGEPAPGAVVGEAAASNATAGNATNTADANAVVEADPEAATNGVTTNAEGNATGNSQ